MKRKLTESVECRVPSDPEASAITFHVSRFTSHVSRITHPASRSPTRHPSPVTRHSQQGVALVITLILLSVITFMAVTFLVVSRTEKGSVTTATDQTIATLAAQAAQERAVSEVLSRIMAFTNQFALDLLVSTNYINSLGFKRNDSNPTNVNYDYTTAGLPLSGGPGGEQQQNLANLLYDPRPPVFMGTNAEFRFYLDLNRNGRFDTNGLQPVISPDPANPYYDTNGNTMPTIVSGKTLSNFFVGDPEWIGLLEKPAYPPSLLNQPGGPSPFPLGYPHSATNKFISRYAYIVLPASKTLDINYIHNYAKLLNAKTMIGGDGFLRNQGVGTWEINLAASLVDLNTNMWPFPFVNAFGTPYYYNWQSTGAGNNSGVAFDDSMSLMRYRYGTNMQANLFSVSSLYGNRGINAFSGDFVDGYSHGNPLMTSNSWPVERDGPLVNFAWAGSDNPNHFFTTQDLFDKSKMSLSPPTPITFADRLTMAGTNRSSYDRYTFYRLLSQLGTDSAPEPAGKINLNYVNVDANGNIVPNMATNFISWTPIQFFTNVAVRLLANAGYATGAGPTNILRSNNSGLPGLHVQIYPTNFYTPSVHRLLQLAANIYDSTTNRGLQYPYYPSVFQPVFEQGVGNQVFISGYREVPGLGVLKATMHDLSGPWDPNGNDMVYGIPLVIGAKKGFPNFNEFEMQTDVQVTRKLQFHRLNDDKTQDVNETNVMYTLSVSNVYGLEAWNSYLSAYPQGLSMQVSIEMAAVLTNEIGPISPPLQPGIVPTQIFPIPLGTWLGWSGNMFDKLSFKVPFDPATNAFAFMTNMTYSDAGKNFIPLTGIFERHPGASLFPVPRLWLKVQSRLRFCLVDTSANRIVDYVNLDSALDPTQKPIDITDLLMRQQPDTYWTDPRNYGPLPDYDTNNYHPSGSVGTLWITTRKGSGPQAPTFGILNQIAVSGGAVNTTWGASNPNATRNFLIQFDPGAKADPARSNIFNAPFNPTKHIYFSTSWQANDPLVHYTIGDLAGGAETNRVQFDTNSASGIGSLANIRHINTRYEPWRWIAPSGASSPTSTDPAFKDPVVAVRPGGMGSSDDWDFPTNKFPNIGWLGKVHRGTPWQTVYLKPGGIALDRWQKWTGNNLALTNFGQIVTTMLPLYATNASGVVGVTSEAFLTQPTNDFHFLDLFTTAFNDNASRGQMSINQSGLAAWSAILSGVFVQPDMNSYTNIEPAGVYDLTAPNLFPPLVKIVNAINDVRATNHYPGNAFQRLGDILAVPELTVRSPYLTGNPKLMNDAVYERIPQQILGLLKAGEQPRFVVYAYGQALKPAPRSVLTSGLFFGMVTNYQITAEVAIRAVVRIENAPANPHAVIESYNVLGPDQ